MKSLARKIRVDTNIAVSSVWLVPDSGASRPSDAFILAHGAGNDMGNPFLSFVHRAIAEAGLLSVKFNFPYKERGGKAPDPAPRLEATFRAVLGRVREDPELAPRRVFLGGKSMGGRMASHLAAAGEDIAGLIFLGYPLHPPKRFDRMRAAHLADIRCPMLFVQGSRDPLCRLDLLQQTLDGLTAAVTLHVIEEGDHSFKVPKRAGRSEQDVWEEINGVVRRWLGEQGA
jgi:predicted alpha/beta-hydrolase family hydrolase